MKLENNARQLKLALHAMDSRSTDTMMLFMRDSCSDAAVIVNASDDADIDIYDADIPNSKKLLEKSLQEKRLKPAIVLSLENYTQEGTYYLKKPIKSHDMLEVLEQVNVTIFGLSIAPDELEEAPALLETEDISLSKTEKKEIDLFGDDFFDFISSSAWVEEPVPISAPEILRRVTAPEKLEPKPVETHQVEEAYIPKVQATELNEQGSIANASAQTDKADGAETEAQGLVLSASALEQANSEIAEAAEDEPEKQELKTYTLSQGRKSSKHKAAMRLDEVSSGEYIGRNEKVFIDYIGGNNDVGLDEPKQFINADYHVDDYFQGYFQYLLISCKEKNQPIMLLSSWCPIALFPLINEVWLNANDSEVKTFAEIMFKKKSLAKEITVAPMDVEIMNMDGALDKFQSLDAFMWKLACWASKGRYPDNIDYRQPVYLRCWPNFTRLLLTPHALRIAALLIQGPRTMINVAQILNIKPESVFVFISAACSIGLAGQAKRMSDTLVEHSEVKVIKSEGLLSRIIRKLNTPIM